MHSSRDTILGECTSIGLRMMFFAQHGDTSKGGGGQEIEVGILREILRCSNLAHKNKGHDGEGLDTLLRLPVASFCNDIVTPYTVERNLPLIVLCEPFRDPQDPRKEPRTLSPRNVMIELPQKFEMLWENRKLELAPFAVRQKIVEFVDSVTFFPSGLFAYCVSFLFNEPEKDLNALDPDLMLVLSAIARPAGAVVGKPVCFKMNDEGAAKPVVPLTEFLRARLNRLAHECNHKSCPNVFSLLNKSDALKALRKCGDSRASQKPKSGEAKRKSEDIGALSNSLEKLFGDGDNSHFSGRISVDIEVLGCSLHDKVLEYASLSEGRKAEVDEFSKALAGLTQNVLDYKEQDKEEIDDSLAGGLTIGSDITFVSKDIAVKFCKESRVTREMRCVVGGSPYWMLVQLVMGHNEALLIGLNEDIDAECGQAGMISALLGRTDPHDVENSRDRTDRALKRKIRFAYYIPNLFRYATERHL